jgi:hypothetical protein
MHGRGKIEAGAALTTTEWTELEQPHQVIGQLATLRDINIEGMTTGAEAYFIHHSNVQETSVLVHGTEGVNRTGVVQC